MSECKNGFKMIQQVAGFKLWLGLRGADGSPGPAGKSAYQAAVEAGFTGTEAEFNEYLSDIGVLTQEVANQKSAFDPVQNSLSAIWKQTWDKPTATVGNNRQWVYYQFVKGKTYDVTVNINSIPPQGTADHLQMNSVKSWSDSPGSVIVDRLLPVRTYQSGDTLNVKYTPTANAAGFYLFSSVSQATAINIDVSISALSFDSAADEYNNYSGEEYRTVAFAKKVRSDKTVNDACYFPFHMKTGQTYHFRMFLSLNNIDLANAGSTLYAFSADNLATSAHDVFVRGMFDTTDSRFTVTGQNVWYYFDYTATHDTDLIFAFMQLCGQGSIAMLQCAVDEYPIVNKDTFTTIGINDRHIYDVKPYPFKRITAYGSGTGQCVVQTGNIVYIATGETDDSGKLIKYVDNVNVETITGEAVTHPFNITILPNGNLLIANIVNYRQQNEVRVVNEFDYDSKTIVHSYTPVVEGKQLVFADCIDSATLLLGYKDKVETEHITYWYTYAISGGTLTLVSQTVRERIYGQGGCLRGGIVYMMENDAESGINRNTPPHLLSIDYKTGEILNTISFLGFGETEGFWISKDQSDGVYGYFIENYMRYVWCMKLN